jgi:hypothetical protein
MRSLLAATDGRIAATWRESREVTRSQRIVFHGEDSIEIATGYGGRGVFLTVLSKRGSRVVTISLGETGAQRLAKSLQQAGEASLKASRAAEAAR